MPNGKIHDNPITDLALHGLHPFPRDVEEMILELYRLDPYVFNELEWAPFDWEEGKHLEEARILLNALIRSHGDPSARQQHIQAYRNATT